MGKITRRTQDAPYPYNLIHDIFGEDQSLENLAPDLDRSLEYIMSTLPERDAGIMQLRYRDGQGIREVAAQYGVTREWTHQIIQQSLRRLRHPSRARYLLYGYEATTKKEEQKRIQAQRQEERILSFLQPDKFVGPLLEIPDARDRADTILARCRLNRIYEVGIPSWMCLALVNIGVQYVWQLCFVQPHELLQMRNIGQKRVAMVEQRLSEHQLALDDGTLSAAPHLWDYVDQRSNELKRIIQEASRETAWSQ